MQIAGKCKIANKWVGGKVEKDSFDFEIKGAVGKGRLTWSDVIKGKNGEKDTFINTTKKFVCFGDNINFINQNLDKYLEIVGKFKANQFTDNKGETIKYDEIVISEVYLSAVKGQSQYDKAKTNGYQNHNDFDDEIPF